MLFSGYIDVPESLHPGDAGQRLKILDLGPARPETVRFFHQVRCRLYFADLFAEQMQSAADTEENKAGELSFPTLGAYPRGEQFDLCFLWDFLNYLDIPTLQAFNLALQPFVHSGTRAHAFTNQSSRSPEHELSYGIEDRDHLFESPRAPPLALDLHCHSLPEIKDHFPCLNVTRSRLLIDGRIEIFMSARGS